MKIIFSPSKVRDLVSVKESGPQYLRSFTFTFPGCNASYIGEIARHLTKKIKERLETDSNSHILNISTVIEIAKNCVILNSLRS